MLYNQMANQSDKLLLQKAPVTASSKSLCPVCKEPHSLTRCAVFQSYELDRRHKIVKHNKFCTNCLHSFHTQSKCTSPFSCRHCRGRHHTLLHKDSKNSEEPTTVTNSFVKALTQDGQEAQVQTSQSVDKGTAAPLAPPEFCFVDTAVVHVVHGDRHLPARAALDSGSGVSLISESLAAQSGRRGSLWWWKQ